MPRSDGPAIAIESLSIRNFRGIAQFSVDLRGPDGNPNRLAVFAGPNGCGKTAILESALIAIGGHKLVVGPLGRRAIRRGESDYEIRASVRDQSSLLDPVTELVTSSRKPLVSHDPAIPFSYFSSWRSPNLIGSVNVTVNRRGRRPARTDSNRLLNVKQQLANAAALENFREASSKPFPNYSAWIDRINSSWARFYPGQRGTFSVGLAGPDSDEAGLGAFDVFHQARPTSPKLPIDDLSAGQLELFLFIAELVIHDQHQGIVFIDEPELHLDPQWHAPINIAYLDEATTPNTIPRRHPLPCDLPCRGFL